MGIKKIKVNDKIYDIVYTQNLATVDGESLQGTGNIVVESTPSWIKVNVNTLSLGSGAGATTGTVTFNSDVTNCTILLVEFTLSNPSGKIYVPLTKNPYSGYSSINYYFATSSSYYVTAVVTGNSGSGGQIEFTTTSSTPSFQINNVYGA